MLRVAGSSLLVLLLPALLAACADPQEAARPTETPVLGDIPPHHRAPPALPYSSNSALLASRVEEAIRLHDRDRWERFFDAMDPGELSADLRVDAGDVADGRWKKEWLFQEGDDTFSHRFTPAEGYGPGGSRVQGRLPTGGPDALACEECHHRGGFDGAGDGSQNAFFDGDARAPTSAFERNPPALLGLGAVERLAAEMTSDLDLQRRNIAANARDTHSRVSRSVQSKGLSFGTLVANADGSFDTRGVTGVDGDLVVRPFGWKGSSATLADFLQSGFQAHFGIQLANADLPGGGKPWDRDRDGVPNELTPGTLDATVLYLSRLEFPVMIPPRDPTLLARHARGAVLFETTGCAACHVPSLPLRDPTLTIAPGLATNVLTEGEPPRPRADDYAAEGDGTPIFLFSDLRRHHMGAGLAENRSGVTYDDPHAPAADVFVTRPLWGVADTAPYLHDGRAATLDDAILDHGGEALTARDHYAHLSADDRTDLRIFLLSLTRYPRIDYR